jgi:predicted small secreted protein
MKTIKTILAVMMVMALAVTFVACGNTEDGVNTGDNGANVFGSEIDKTIYIKATADDILASPTDEFFDKDVYVDAVITKICPAGCWFFVKDYGTDSSIELYIDKFKERFLVPQGLEGTRVMVYGHVEANVRNNILAAVRMEIVK